MWTDLRFNLILLMMSDYFFILAASNVGYIIFNFLNLNAGWIQVSTADWERPYRRRRSSLRSVAYWHS